VRSGKIMNIHNPVMFLAQDRELADEAWPGDIIGIPNHGNLRIGDALTEGEDLQFNGIPSFAPELLQRVRPTDPLRAKHLEKAIVQLAEEGAAKAFKTRIGGSWIVGVVGALQFDVLADRIRTEYDVPVTFEPAALHTARWLEADDPAELKKFMDANQGDLADDHDDMPVFMARNGWHLQHTAENWPKVKFLKVKEQMA
jgi:peptide chain release factor 3